MSHFKLVLSTKASGMTPVNKYVSDKTGLTVVIATVDGPLVHGFFCTATDGKPSDECFSTALEELMLLGSERYPYKDTLNLLTTRCMGYRRDMWNNTHYTCVRVDTAGDNGMLTLLPIYLDHILWPMFTEHSYITKVHHVNGDGEDAGPVYTYIQEIKSSAYDRWELQLLGAMNPDSGYCADPTDFVKNLRTSIDIKAVKDFHQKFYRSENLTLILTGQIEAEDVFAALGTVEDDIIAKRESDPQEPWVHPRQSIIPSPQYGQREVQWPADVEEYGKVVFGWRGPLLTETNSPKNHIAIEILLDYLCVPDDAPLHRHLVALRKDALTSEAYGHLIKLISPIIRIELENVPLDKLELARDEALQCIRQLRSGEQVIDVERLRRLLRIRLHDILFEMESHPQHAVAYRCIDDFLYSHGDQSVQFTARLNPETDILALLEESPEYWLGLLQKYFTDDVVIILGSPSIALKDKLAEEERIRLEEQRAQLGAAGLAEKAKRLQEAKDFKECPPPADVLASVPIPAPSFKFHHVNSWSSGAEPCPHFDLTRLPMYARVANLKTNLVCISLILDTSSVEERCRKWLPLHMSGLGQCAVRRGDTLIPHHEVISTTERLTATYHISMGFDPDEIFISQFTFNTVGQFSNFVNFETWCKPQDYEAVVNHLHEILYAAEITKERLLEFAQTLLDEANQIRGRTHKMLLDTLRDSVYNKNSNVHWCTALRQHKFLTQLIEQLNAGGDSAEAALLEARQTFKSITHSVWLHLATDFDRYQLSTEPWNRFAAEIQITPAVPRLYSEPEQLANMSDGFVVGMESNNSCGVAQMSPAPLGHHIQDVAPLMVALNYFTQIEGLKWAPSTGTLTLTLCGSDSITVYSKMKALVEEYLSATKLDDDLFESAKNATLFQVAEEWNCLTDVVRRSILNYLQGPSAPDVSEVVEAVSAVSAEDAHAAAAKWFPSLFDQQRGRLAVVCRPDHIHHVCEAFHKLNVKLDVFESLEAFSD